MPPPCLILTRHHYLFRANKEVVCKKIIRQWFSDPYFGHIHASIDLSFEWSWSRHHPYDPVVVVRDISLWGAEHSNQTFRNRWRTPKSGRTTQLIANQDRLWQDSDHVGGSARSPFHQQNQINKMSFCKQSLASNSTTTTFRLTMAWHVIMPWDLLEEVTSGRRRNCSFLLWSSSS